MILGVLLIWCVFDVPQLLKPINVVRPIVRPVIDEIRDRVIDPITKKEVSGPTVIVVSRDWCKYCQDLIRDEMPKAKAMGYTVIVDKKTSAPSYPLTRIWNGKRWETRVGFFRWVKP